MNHDVALVATGEGARPILAIARWPLGAESFGVAPDGEVIELPADTACAGQLWDGQAVSDPESEPAVTVPQSVSMRQARLALLAAGLLPTVEAYMAAAPEAVQIEWQYATDIWRDRDLVSGIGTSLGLTSDQIDALFIAAKAIP